MYYQTFFLHKMLKRNKCKTKQEKYETIIRKLVSSSKFFATNKNLNSKNQVFLWTNEEKKNI